MTALNEEHVRLGARMVEFAGWEMPIQYSSIMKEHMAVRGSAGIFDVSHMGQLFLTGDGVETLVDRAFTNTFKRRKPGAMEYTHMLDEEGRIIDDMIGTWLDEETFFVVPNAATTETVKEWLGGLAAGAGSVTFQHDPSRFCIAVQGPSSEGILETALDIDLSGLKFFRLLTAEIGGGTCFVSRSGYTGENGFEVYGPAEQATTVWNRVLEKGSPEGMVPVGLGARDTLRLEKCFLLSGQDFHNDRTPLEADHEWVIEWDHDFVGKEALERQKEAGGYRRWSAVLMADRGVPRPGCEVVIPAHDRSPVGRPIGEVTSGTVSPVLNKGIAMAYLDEDRSAPGTTVEIEIRKKGYTSSVVEKPFVKQG